MSIYGVNGSYNNYSAYQANINQDVEKSKMESSNAQTANEAATINNVTSESSQFKSVSDYTSYLFKTYNYFGRSASVEGVPTTVSVSGAFLSKCINDPEKAEYLESNLNAITDSISYVKSHSLGTLVNASYNIDANGNISMMTTSTNDPDGKIARENAKKATEEKIEFEARVEERRENQSEIAGPLSNWWEASLDFYA